MKTSSLAGRRNSLNRILKETVCGSPSTVRLKKLHLEIMLNFKSIIREPTDHHNAGLTKYPTKIKKRKKAANGTNRIIFLYIYICRCTDTYVSVSIWMYTVLYSRLRRKRRSLRRSLILSWCWSTVMMNNFIKHRCKENRLAVRRHLFCPAGRLNIVACHAKTCIYYHLQFGEHQSPVSLLYLH